jgi:hypothetical protein
MCYTYTNQNILECGAALEERKTRKMMGRFEGALGRHPFLQQHESRILDHSMLTYKSLHSSQKRTKRDPQKGDVDMIYLVYPFPISQCSRSLHLWTRQSSTGRIPQHLYNPTKRRQVHFPIGQKNAQIAKLCPRCIKLVHKLNLVIRALGKSGIIR